MKNEMMFILALIAILGIAWSQGWLDGTQVGPVDKPPVGQNASSPTYSFQGSADVQYDAVAGQFQTGNPWKINNVQWRINQLPPLFAGWGLSDEVKLDYRLIRADGTKSCSGNVDLGKFNVIQGESKSAFFVCDHSIFKSRYVLQLRICEKASGSGPSTSTCPLGYVERAIYTNLDVVV